MNKIVSFSLVLALAVLIVLSVAGPVNATAGSHMAPNSALFASGSPAPPPTPPAVNQSALVASGSPAPPPTPPAMQQSVLVASGSPAPPPTPRQKMIAPLT